MKLHFCWTGPTEVNKWLWGGGGGGGGGAWVPPAFMEGGGGGCPRFRPIQSVGGGCCPLSANSASVVDAHVHVCKLLLQGRGGGHHSVPKRGAMAPPRDAHGGGGDNKIYLYEYMGGGGGRAVFTPMTYCCVSLNGVFLI